MRRRGLRSGWERKGGERGRRAAGNALLAGFLLLLPLTEVKCVESYLYLRGIVLDDVAGFKGFATLSKRTRIETEGTLSLALAYLRHDLRMVDSLLWGIVGIGEGLLGAGSVPGVGSDLCGRGRGDGGVRLDGLDGTGERFASCLEGLQVKIGVLVALDGEVLLGCFV